MCRACNGPEEATDIAEATRSPSLDTALGRRSMLAGGIVALVGAGRNSRIGMPAVARRRKPTIGAVPMPQIHPRSDWASAEFPVRGSMEPEDPKFLIVHHTETTNDYDEAGVVEEIRDIYRFHTGAEKGWPDIAYNFFVDRYGGIWEARSGSLDGPVRGSATGGNQGYTQLVCVIGSFKDQQPPDAALRSLTNVLAWLGDRYAIDTAPGATVNFTSLGSNRHAAGAAVTTTTIAGHREMSQTDCPGDAFFPLVKERLPADVSAIRGAATPTTAASTTVPATSSSVTVESTATTLAVVEPGDPAVTSTSRPRKVPISRASREAGRRDEMPLLVGGGVAAAGAALGAASFLAVRRNRLPGRPRPVVATALRDDVFAAWSDEYDFGMISVGLDRPDIDRLWDTLVGRQRRVRGGGAATSPPLSPSAVQKLVARVATARGPQTDLAVVIRSTDRVVCGLSRNAALVTPGPDSTAIVRIASAGSVLFADGREPPWDLVVGDLSTIGNDTFSAVRQELATADLDGRLSAE